MGPSCRRATIIASRRASRGVSGTWSGCVPPWTAQGKTRDEIAVIIGISAETVKTHAKSVMRKLDAVNNVSAVARTYER